MYKRAHQWRLSIFIQHQYISSMSRFLSNGRKETLSLILTKMLLKAFLGAGSSLLVQKICFHHHPTPFLQLPRTKCSTLNFLGLSDIGTYQWPLSVQVIKLTTPPKKLWSSAGLYACTTLSHEMKGNEGNKQLLLLSLMQ